MNSSQPGLQCTILQFQKSQRMKNSKILGARRASDTPGVRTPKRKLGLPAVTSTFLGLETCYEGCSASFIWWYAQIPERNRYEVSTCTWHGNRHTYVRIDQRQRGHNRQCGTFTGMNPRGESKWWPTVIKIRYSYGMHTKYHFPK